jgi:hypothetical protein
MNRPPVILSAAKERTLGKGMMMNRSMAARIGAQAQRGHPIEENRTMAMAVETMRWTRADLERLPDDENRYEVVRGELFVTPPPSGAAHTRGSADSASRRRGTVEVDTPPRPHQEAHALSGERRSRVLDRRS